MPVWVRSAAAAALMGCLAVAAWILWPVRTDVVLPPGVSSTSAEMAARGAYMVRAAGCVACHTDSAGGGKPFAGGRPIETPFGTFHSPNITPDVETGIGRWSDEDFVRAVMLGEGVDGEHLYPVFPYTSYAKMGVEDVVAIKAYLFTLEPVRATALPNDVEFPFGWRSLLKVWKLLYLDTAPLSETVASRSASWVRGRYLVAGPGHCGECHTPRGLLGARDAQRELQGQPHGPEGWAVPALAGPRAAEFAQWSQDEIETYLETGDTPDFDAVQGPMKEVIQEGTRFLTREDRRAMAIYLKALSE
jgi:mono/diheme cytochrome c family protein